MLSVTQLQSALESTYLLLLLSGAPPGLVVLGQQQLLVQHVHPLLPLDVQSGSHPQRRLVAGLGALMTTDVEIKLLDGQNKCDSKTNESKY